MQQASDRPSLRNLPTELKEQIARFVDPIGLFSLRLIDNNFRRIIQPQRQQYVEHLLALECSRGYGGCFIPFTNVHGRPLWIDAHALATRARWACTGCVRLLPYYHFQHQFLTDLSWQKPLPGFPTDNIITSWEPGHAGRNLRVVAPLLGNGDRRLLDYYNVNPRLWWIFYAGRYRHLRRCNECRFRNPNIANIASFNNMYGTESFPIVAIETHIFTSPLDRYFPGIPNPMQQGRQSPSSP
ncbi:hypothetical protein F52700_7905 [Fusarium sp. NRRL 52700]|nr:hypothetical protein F52700_7905 [Fusarium sp. NRRL 52700]